jgi:DnaK suppressor protein
MAFSDRQCAELRAILEGHRRDLEARLRVARSETQPVSLDLPIGRLSRMDALQQQSMAVGQQRRMEQELRQITAALQRLEREEYGCCLRCGESIAYERLIVRPVSTLCVSCQEASEPRR